MNIVIAGLISAIFVLTTMVVIMWRKVEMLNMVVDKQLQRSSDIDKLRSDCKEFDESVSQLMKIHNSNLNELDKRERVLEDNIESFVKSIQSSIKREIACQIAVVGYRPLKTVPQHYHKEGEKKNG